MNRRGPGSPPPPVSAGWGSETCCGLAGLLVALAGCGGDSAGNLEDSTPVGCWDVPATVDIGGSSTDAEGRPIWTEMKEKSEQIMVHGPQGGWHILASALVEHTSDIVTINYAIEWPAKSAQVAFGTFRVMLVRDGDCGGYYAEMRGILDVADFAVGDADTPPEVLAGETLELQMDIVDTENRTASDTRSVVAALDPADIDSGE